MFFSGIAQQNEQCIEKECLTCLVDKLKTDAKQDRWWSANLFKFALQPAKVFFLDTVINGKAVGAYYIEQRFLWMKRTELNVYNGEVHFGDDDVNGLALWTEKNQNEIAWLHKKLPEKEGFPLEYGDACNLISVNNTYYTLAGWVCRML